MTIQFNKYTDGLVPVIVQDAKTRRVLMLGYMNEQAYERTIKEERVCFFSRSRQSPWMKGETSGNYLRLVSIFPDCDADALLVLAEPAGPVCHTGADTCFGQTNGLDFLHTLESTIEDRKNNDRDNSYTSSLFRKGINAVAQKVGEEAVELVIEAKDDNRERFLNEAADLLFHYLVLLRAKGCRLDDVEAVLKARHNG
jgi:phosphoribosyl-ATP pyrophosphohydrolase/phosphoribosyl-AMP cyclohydrolase